MATPPKRGRGRPPLTEAEKKKREKRAQKAKEEAAAKREKERAAKMANLEYMQKIKPHQNENHGGTTTLNGNTTFSGKTT